MRKTVVINAVGLTHHLLQSMPRTRAIGKSAIIGHVTPAVTCSVQATYLTGALPHEHGIVGNGWYFRDLCEIKFWHQSDKLVQRPRIWDIAKQRDPKFTCANLFWWNAMYSSCDVTVTPRPMYPADGRKLPDIWTHPQWLRSKQEQIGQFPLFKFWGPGAEIESTQWIAEMAVEVDCEFNPTLSLIYLPHLDYNLQRLEPDDARIQDDLKELDDVIGRLIDHYRTSEARVIVLSEYGIEPVSKPIHLNRILREQKLLNIRTDLGGEMLDAGASVAFAVADHQVAHIYVNDPSKTESVRAILKSAPGVAEVLKIDHPRGGDFVVVAEPGAWFTYYYWLDDANAPDFARTVDIHRKPGYDPVELFTDHSSAAISWKLLKRKAGFRTLMDVIPLDANLVRGSHGRKPSQMDRGPVLISSEPTLLPSEHVAATDVRDLILRHLDLL